MISHGQKTSSNFSQTCNLLSQYLKGRGNPGDLNLRIAPISGNNNSSMLPDLNLDLNMAEPEKETAHQMTIFYRGHVIVFDEFSKEKAEEIMQLASKSNISSTCSSGSSVSTHNSSYVVSHIPIARKASLHRFLEKRKGRILAKAPYQLNISHSAHTKPAEISKAWLGLSSESATLELQL